MNEQKECGISQRRCACASLGDDVDSAHDQELPEINRLTPLTIRGVSLPDMR
jgi:hypothetical protein